MELTFIYKNNGSIYVIDVDILLSGGQKAQVVPCPRQICQFLV